MLQSAKPKRDPCNLIQLFPLSRHSAERKPATNSVLTGTTLPRRKRPFHRMPVPQRERPTSNCSPSPLATRMPTPSRPSVSSLPGSKSRKRPFRIISRLASGSAKPFWPLLMENIEQTSSRLPNSMVHFVMVWGLMKRTRFKLSFDVIRLREETERTRISGIVLLETQGA